MKIKFLKAQNGDSIHLSYKDGAISRNILIDGGMPTTYIKKNKKEKIENGELKNTIETIKALGEKIDLLILTHVDNDHIGGILKWFECDETAQYLIGKVWFNSGRLISEYYKQGEIKENLIELIPDNNTNTSIEQGVKFEDYLEEKDIWDRRIICNYNELSYLGLQFKILSPNLEKLKLLLKKWKKEQPDSTDTAVKNDYNKTLLELIENDKFEEDDSEHNGSSIAFIIKHKEQNLVFLGDAHPSVVVDSLKYFGHSVGNPLQAELVKISHHGSKANNSKELLKLIRTNNYVISTNGDRHAHPNKQLLARLISINNNCNVYFNYPEQIDHIFLKEDYLDFPNFNPLTLENNLYKIDYA